jgi:hypothetical protein
MPRFDAEYNFPTWVPKTRVNMTKRRITGVNLCVHHVLPRGLHNISIIIIINWSCAKNRHEVRLSVCIFIGDASHQKDFHSRNQGWFLSIQGTFRQHSRNIQGTFRKQWATDYDRPIQGQFRGNSGPIQGTFRGRPGNIELHIMMGQFREHSGNIQGTFRERSGTSSTCQLLVPHPLPHQPICFTRIYSRIYFPAVTCTVTFQMLSCWW